jgi:hypothetical protein
LSNETWKYSPPHSPMDTCLARNFTGRGLVSVTCFVRMFSDCQKHRLKATTLHTSRKPVHSRRSRARTARAVTGDGWSGSASLAPTAGQPQVGAASRPRCADMLSAMENSDFRKVRPCQKSCSKPLHRHTTDRGAPWALYPAVKRSVVCASPVLRYPSPNRHRTKTGTSRTRAGSTLIRRS